MGVSPASTRVIGRLLDGVSLRIAGGDDALTADVVAAAIEPLARERPADVLTAALHMTTAAVLAICGPSGRDPHEVISTLRERLGDSPSSSG